MSSYTWICHSCKEPNSPGTEVCQICGFPAVASEVEIRRGFAGVKRTQSRSRKEIEKARRAEIASLPLWKKLFAYPLQLVDVIGGVVVLGGVFDLSLTAIGIGFAIIAVAELLYQLLKGKPYQWEIG